MNPGSSEKSGLNLPPPVGEVLPTPVETAQNKPAKPEQGPAAPERNTQAGQSAAAGLPAIPLPLPADIASAGTPVPPVSPVKSSTATSNPAVTADDGDLIEKEWVNKARAIVERTRNNPHQQSQELTVVKADYMKQRYDKTIKVNP
jgi:hypothetical protein